MAENQKYPAKKALIGVFITSKHARDLAAMNGRLLSSHHYVRFIELARAGLETGVCLYFFSGNRVHFKKKWVLGIYFDFRRNRWREKKFPFPDILYDRGGGMSKEAWPVIGKFKKMGIGNINGQHYFDKWDLYERLSRLEMMRPHLPLTVKGEKAHHILPMLDRYGQIYVKTCRGSCGSGVIRITKHGAGSCRYDYSLGGRLFSAVLTERELPHFLARHLASRPFIIQKAIDLLKKGESIIDFRSEVHQSESGEVVVLATTARIGRPRSPIASHTRTKDYYPLETFLKEIMHLEGEKAREFQEKIHRFLHTVFRAIEYVYGPCGELGIDFGMDTQGRLWLIECNSKSAKVALYRAFGPQKVRQSFGSMLRYAQSLLEKENRSDIAAKGA